MFIYIYIFLGPGWTLAGRDPGRAGTRTGLGPGLAGPGPGRVGPWPGRDPGPDPGQVGPGQQRTWRSQVLLECGVKADQPQAGEGEYPQCQVPYDSQSKPILISFVFFGYSSSWVIGLDSDGLYAVDRLTFCVISLIFRFFDISAKSCVEC